MPLYKYMDEGTGQGVRYVTVLDRGGNPIEYEIPVEDARMRYPEKARIRVNKDTGVGDEFSWYFTVEHMPIDTEGDAMEYGRVASFQEALDYATFAALHPESFDHHGCQCIAVAARYREASA